MVGFLIVVVTLNFIPIKFAKKVDTLFNDADGMGKTGYVELIAMHTKKTGIAHYPWEAYYDLHTGLKSMVFAVNNGSPYDTLNGVDFHSPNGEGVIDLDFILEGDMQFSCMNDAETVGEFTVSGWDIVYPIRRRSFRRHFTPKSYLTIYDFNWIEVIEGLFA